MDQSEVEIALNNCAREPVHIPGRVQPFGAMFAFDLHEGQLIYHSENLPSMILQDGSFCIGRDYKELLGNRHAVHAVRGALGLPTIQTQRDRVGIFEIGGRNVDVSVFSIENTGVIELEPAQLSFTPRQSPVASMRAMMSSITTGKGMTQLLDSSARVLRHLTGHDRVMVYRFFDNGDGEVVAEAKGPGIEPYLELRYPASDIPTQVRQIMLRAPFRVIHDVRAEHVAVVAANGAKALDLTLSHLRGVAPVHIEYLENMGVRATMNISIIVRDRLWGLFAFHHYRPRLPTADQRTICELFGQLVSMLIQQEEERVRLEQRRLAQSTIVSIGEIDHAAADVDTVIELLSKDLMQVVKADGVGILWPETAKFFGSVPADEVIRELSEMAKEDLVSIDSLIGIRQWPDLELLGKSAGSLLLRLPQQGWLAFFRNEVKHEIRWAGAQEKALSYGPDGPRLTPRGSFAEYTESISGRCVAWTQTDLDGAAEICRELWKHMLTATADHSQQFARDKRQQDLLIAELNHRVRNTLALVQSIARQTSTSAVSIERYVEMLEQRIGALAKAHNLVGSSGMQWARIEDIARTELKPYQFDGQTVSLSGPPIAVRADVVPLIALLFHEMTSNAVKHGALSGVGGSLDVQWFEEAGGVSIQWTETLLEKISQPADRGFGFALIERAIPHECNGRSSIEFMDRALLISFWLPAEALDRLATPNPVIALTNSITPVPTAELDLSDIDTVMLVENNLVLAMEIERMLSNLGVQTVDTFGAARSAESALAKASYQCAILDINLGEGTSFVLAEKLHAAGSRVVFASGYDNKLTLPESLTDIPMITKPVSIAELVSAIRHPRQDAAS